MEWLLFRRADRPPFAVKWYQLCVRQAEPRRAGLPYGVCFELRSRRLSEPKASEDEDLTRGRGSCPRHDGGNTSGRRGGCGDRMGRHKLGHSDHRPPPAHLQIVFTSAVVPACEIHALRQTRRRLLRGRLPP